MIRVSMPHKSLSMWAIALTLGLGSAPAAYAAEASKAAAAPMPNTVAGMKFGYVDMARALNDVDDGKQAKARLKRDFEAKQKRLDKMQNDLRDRKDAFDKQVGMMKPEAKRQKEEELQRTMMEVQQTYMQLQQELVESEGAITGEIRKKLQAVIDRLGDRDDFFLILNTAESVLYHKRHMDLTDDVIREYNKQYTKK